MLTRNFSKLGDTGIKRVVILQGTLNVSQFFSPNIFDVENDIKAGLRNAGFDVVSVRIVYGYIGYSGNVTIELNVDTAYSAEQARQNATQVISNITRSLGVTSIKVFFDVNLSVSRDLQPNQTIVTPNENTRINTLPANPSNNSSGLDSFLKGAGISAPLAIVAAGVVLLIVLRK